ncbi:Hypothetical protein A7982_11113 [Minicystis rosea]|nr:Hypothetical protein A7982_11113 [Minicystis rosea]
MGIPERRAREHARRRQEILDAAWAVAEEGGWASFHLKGVAQHAELGRTTLYEYFTSLDMLVKTMAEQALEILESSVAAAESLADALDVPLRLSQRRPAAFSLLLLPTIIDPRPAFASEDVLRARRRATQMLSALHRLASRSGAALPESAMEAQAFLAGVAMAGASVPALRSSTPLRRRFQDFCLALGGDARAAGDAAAADAADRKPR